MSLQYEPLLGIMEVTIHKGSGLKKMDLNGTSGNTLEEMIQYPPKLIRLLNIFIMIRPLREDMVVIQREADGQEEDMRFKKQLKSRIRGKV